MAGRYEQIFSSPSLPFTQHFHRGTRYEADAHSATTGAQKNPTGQQTDAKPLLDDENTDQQIATDDEDSMAGDSENDGENVSGDDGSRAPDDQQTGENDAGDDDGSDDGGDEGG